MQAHIPELVQWLSSLSFPSLQEWERTFLCILAMLNNFLFRNVLDIALCLLQVMTKFGDWASHVTAKGWSELFTGIICFLILPAKQVIHQVCIHHNALDLKRCICGLQGNCQIKWLNHYPSYLRSCGNPVKMFLTGKEET